jgi:hypothetical protein
MSQEYKTLDDVVPSKQPKATHIAGRRWFDRTYGNTYHTFQIFFTDGTSFKSAIMYGYGDHYLTTAFAKLESLQLMHPRDRQRLTHALHEAGITWNVSDVGRKKDL